MGIHSNERQDKIFSMLESRGRMSVSDLAEYFQVTETTIRRDQDSNLHAFGSGT